jgi:hypothetical protein
MPSGYDAFWYNFEIVWQFHDTMTCVGEVEGICKCTLRYGHESISGTPCEDLCADSPLFPVDIGRTLIYMLV